MKIAALAVCVCFALLLSASGVTTDRWQYWALMVLAGVYAALWQHIGHMEGKRNG